MFFIVIEISRFDLEVKVSEINLNWGNVEPFKNVINFRVISDDFNAYDTKNGHHL